MATIINGGVPVPTNSPGATYVVPRAYRRKLTRFSTGRVVWGGLLRVLQRITHYKHGDRLEFKIAYSVKDQVEALVQAVQKAGSYQAREDATRAVHAVWDGLKDRVPPEVLSKLAESLPLREAARLGRSTGQQRPKTSSLDDPEGTQPRDAG
jgi:hypothetical protein